MTVERAHHTNIAGHTSLADLSQCIILKIMITYDCIHDWLPPYFRDVCKLVVSIPFHFWLCSADNNDMIVPSTRIVSYDAHSFHVISCDIWHPLPSHLKNINISHEHSKSGLENFLCKPTHRKCLCEHLCKYHFTNIIFHW